MSRSVSAIFFDVDETLVDFERAAVAAFHTVFGADADYTVWAELTREWYPRHLTMPWQDMRVGRAAAFLRTLGRSADAASVEARRMRLIDEALMLFPDVPDCLGALRTAGLRLGVITNSEPVYQRNKLARVGLGDAFDVVVISGEIGAAKPDRAIFEHACRALGVEPGAALHIGDRLDADALGALGAGLGGVWLDRHDRAGDERRVPVVSTLSAVPALVA